MASEIQTVSTQKINLDTRDDSLVVMDGSWKDYREERVRTAQEFWTVSGSKSPVRVNGDAIERWRIPCVHTN